MPANLAITFPGQNTGTMPVSDRLTSDNPIVGTSDALKYVMYRVDQVASTNTAVLLLGETGTGKELVARAIHQRSSRRNRNFVVVDCGALPGSLIESELFGRERGAFTDAHTAQAGRFELASGGTIFLDEIGELPLELQPKLLRVLQERQVERLGSTRTTTVDVRVIAATNRDLSEEVRAGRFRRDLFYRLNVFPIALPALRDRREDLPALVRYLCDRIGRELGKSIARISPESLAALAGYEWPGNIRELENVITRAIIASRGGTLDLTGFVGDRLPVSDMAIGPASGDPAKLVDVERRHIHLALQRSNWRIEGTTGAAHSLGMRPSTLRSLMGRLGIRRPALTLDTAHT